MAQLFFDPTEYAVSDDLLALNIWGVAHGTVESFVIADIATFGKVAHQHEPTNSANLARALDYKAAGTVSGEVEIYVSYVVSDANAAECVPEVSMNADRFRGGQMRVGGAVSWSLVIEQGAGTLLASLAHATPVINTIHKQRFLVEQVGSNWWMRVKQWRGVDEEPAWMLSHDFGTTAPAAGTVGFYRERRTDNLYVVGYGVGTDGDPAPTGPVGGARRRSPLLLTPW